MVENGRLKLGEKKWSTTIVGTPMVFNLMQPSRRVHDAFSCSKEEANCLPNVGESVDGQVNF
jgi:hypothetical protein